MANDTILMTGAGTGIGLAMARLFLAEGHRVIGIGRRPDVLEAARAAAPGLVTRPCDITRPGDRVALVHWLGTEHADLSMLVNNAGIQRAADFANAPPSDDAVTAEIAVNLAAPIQLTAALLPLLRRQPRARVVNVTSGLAFCPLASVPVYCATKAALHSFTLSLRHQLRATPVRVIEIAPPIVDTELDQGRRGPADRPGMTAEAFAEAALAGLRDGQEEIVVGFAQGLRTQGEAMFGRLNPSGV
ncbi:SDR family oxidoreductase [Rubellimicrobium arenae]|uniref:SDR family oxidoreductase n=1 Tax=Rubellimicrobium arenae TaxID=2817372 RepID=UPI001B313192|nr:SDR family NAD(P)-dependent oxidoreductase [Rubellimicrobium arenae]